MNDAKVQNLQVFILGRWRENIIKCWEKMETNM